MARFCCFKSEILTALGAALLMGAPAAQSATNHPGRRLLEQARQTKGQLAEDYLRQAIAFWRPVQPKPVEYLERGGLLGILGESRTVQHPDSLRTELEPILEPVVEKMNQPGFAGDSLMAARVLEVYAILLERTGRERDAPPLFLRAKSLRFPQLQKGVILPALHAGDGISAPRLIHRMEPEYAEDARIAKQQGTVRLLFVVDEQGRPRDVQVVRNLGLGLDEQAVQAVSAWIFEPGMKDGQPVRVQTQVEVNFRVV